MLVIPFRISEKQYSIFVVLEEENMERLRAYDPAEVIVPQVEERMSFSGGKLKDVVIGYATAKDMDVLKTFFEQNKIREALQYLSRGWRYRPDAGDHDRGPEHWFKVQ